MTIDWDPPADPEGIHAATGTGEDLVLRREGAVAELVLSRPEKRNALTAEMSWGMGRMLRMLSEDATVHAVVISAQGPAFCAGGDVGGFPVQGQQDSDEAKARAATSRHNSPADRSARGEVYPGVAIRDAPFPVIAAVNGPAAGAGFSLALSCDLVVADPQARFGALQVARGLVADWGLVWMLVRRIGISRALEVAWEGGWVDAQRALDLGLVNRISAPGEARDGAIEWATRLAAGPSVAIELESLMQTRAFRTADAAEGARAFRERRPPAFTGS
jgi:2-(1,2-epoxy-1,2-dihydrophenyl)acetyl-CoA isomerase